jgi:hypothetical protein
LVVVAVSGQPAVWNHSERAEHIAVSSCQIMVF